MCCAMTDYAVPTHRSYLERTLGAHAAYTLHYHLVWSVKGRRRLLVGAVASTLCAELLRAAEDAGVTLLTVHVEPEHVHVIMSLRPDMAVSSMVPRPIDLGPIPEAAGAGLERMERFPILRTLLLWLIFAAVLGAIFHLTR